MYQLKAGMTKQQVEYVMGTPLIVDTFNRDQWHYFYSLRAPGGQTLTQTLSINFENDKLSTFNADHTFPTEDSVDDDIAETVGARTNKIDKTLR